MKIIFKEQHIDTGTYSIPIVIDIGDTAELLDIETGRIRITEGYDVPIELEFVPVTKYIPVKDD